MKMTRVIGKWDFHCVADGMEVIRVTDAFWVSLKDGDSISAATAKELEATFQNWRQENAFRFPFQMRNNTLDTADSK